MLTIIFFKTGSLVDVIHESRDEMAVDGSHQSV